MQVQLLLRCFANHPPGQDADEKSVNTCGTYSNVIYPMIINKRLQVAGRLCHSATESRAASMVSLPITITIVA